MAKTGGTDVIAWMIKVVTVKSLTFTTMKSFGKKSRNFERVNAIVVHFILVQVHEIECFLHGFGDTSKAAYSTDISGL